jgi:hypothetical protein
VRSTVPSLAGGNRRYSSHERPGNRPALETHAVSAKYHVAMHERRLLAITGGCFLAAFFAAPFLYGAVAAVVRGEALACVFAGFVWTIISTISLGFPWTAGGTKVVSMWPYILICWLALVVVAMVSVKLRQNKPRHREKRRLYDDL